MIVATSVNENNDKLVTFLKEKGELVFRGSENDVLDRFIKAAEINDVDGIVRICSDNPFMDWHGVAQLVEKAKTSTADYIGFCINDKPSILTHFGFGVSLYAFQLSSVWQETQKRGHLLMSM